MGGNLGQEQQELPEGSKVGIACEGHEDHTLVKTE